MIGGAPLALGAARRAPRTERAPVRVDDAGRGSLPVPSTPGGQPSFSFLPPVAGRPNFGVFTSAWPAA